MADRFNLSISSLHNIIGRVCDMIYDMAVDIIVLPDENRKKKTADHFYNKNGFPNVLGKSYIAYNLIFL